ncbi:MAG: GreA/GreB family elongation factor [Verrucomicrobia bacterium]|nr:GreA/GreB family elongation factor [Verrucomicrobiota bacterium]
MYMSYLKDFQKHIANHNYPYFLKLWEEYCSGDELDGVEVINILKAVKNASFVELFGKQIERILPLWEKMSDKQLAHEIFRLVVDIENTQNPKMGEKVFEYLKSLYGDESNFNEKIRLINFRNRDKFQGAISNYELLSHVKKGNFVFHTAGWGVGIITDYSNLREQITLEFDYVAGKKDLSFATAFKTLFPVSKEHFLARRFGNPDELEKYAKQDPVELIRMLLKDLGPKTASDIKDELCELVIPAEEWSKWWQNARSKVRKDTMIETPKDLKGEFRIREAEETHEERLQKVFESKPDADTLIQMTHSFIKDFPETLKNAQFKQNLVLKLQEILEYPEVTPEQQLQLYFFLQDLQVEKQEDKASQMIEEVQTAKNILELINKIQVLAFKKRILTVIREKRTEWQDVFLNLLLSLDQSSLRDYVLAELLDDKKEEEVKLKIEELCRLPSAHPDAFIWCFQKVMGTKKFLFSDKSGKIRFFEVLLILLSQIEHKTEERDLVRKIHGILSAGRFSLVREMMQISSKEEVQEFLLLATKCHSIDDHDIKILHSLAEVAHPSIAKSKKKSKDSSEDDANVIWTTEKGYAKLQQRIQQIATVETVENAKEIETARSHGDLRENAEFKASLEKRDRLQGELKTLSDQLHQARIITAQDILTDKVGIGSVVTCKNAKGQEVKYTLLGPWDADPEKNILAFQSKLAQTMKGCSVGDAFQFQGEMFTIVGIGSYL